MSREAIIEVLHGHFGKDKIIEDSTHLMDDLGGDELDIIDCIIQIENELDIKIPEEETFELKTVSELLTVVGRHVQPN